MTLHPQVVERIEKVDGLKKHIATMKHPGEEEGLYNAMRIPMRYRRKTMAQIDLTHIDIAKLAEAERAITAGRNVVITGSVGGGKTHIAVCLLWLAVKNRIEVGVNTWGEVSVLNSPWFDSQFLAAQDLQAEMRSTPWKEHEAIEKYVTPDTLLLDDLGAEQRTEITRSWIGALIDRRYRAERQTIVTSNLTLEELAAAVDDRAVSRLIEGGMHLRIKAPDFRLKGGKA